MRAVEEMGELAGVGSFARAVTGTGSAGLGLVKRRAMKRRKARRRASMVGEEEEWTARRKRMAADGIRNRTESLALATCRESDAYR